MPVGLGALCGFVSVPLVRAAVLLTVILLLPVVAWHVLSSWRDRDRRADTEVDEVANFREMHRQGVLADYEFRTIRTLLEERHRSAIRRDGENS